MDLPSIARIDSFAKLCKLDRHSRLFIFVVVALPTFPIGSGPRPLSINVYVCMCVNNNDTHLNVLRPDYD